MIRRARPHDASALSALAQRSKAHWGYDDAFMSAHRTGLTIGDDYIVENPTFLIEAHGVPVAFYALERVDDTWVELGFMFVEPACIGHGLGRRLFAHAMDTAHALGYTHMRIVSDPHAAGFYGRMGARPWGEWHSPIVPGRRLPVLQLECNASAPRDRV